MEDDAVVWHAWTPEQSESAFPGDIAQVALHTTVVDADSKLAKQLLADPLDAPAHRSCWRRKIPAEAVQSAQGKSRRFSFRPPHN